MPRLTITPAGQDAQRVAESRLVDARPVRLRGAHATGSVRTWIAAASRLPWAIASVGGAADDDMTDLVLVQGSALYTSPGSPPTEVDERRVRAHGVRRRSPPRQSGLRREEPDGRSAPSSATCQRLHHAEPGAQA